MAAKYHCPQCKCRFVEWGAAKLEFKCPTEGCNHTKLILLQNPRYANIKTASTGRRSKKTVLAVSNPEDSILAQTDSINDDDVVADAASDQDEDDFGDACDLNPEKEMVVFEYVETERNLPVGDTKGKKEKSKAQKQKVAKDLTAAKKKQDKLPKSNKP